jgi:hypothetical protein
MVNGWFVWKMSNHLSLLIFIWFPNLLYDKPPERILTYPYDFLSHRASPRECQPLDVAVGAVHSQGMECYGTQSRVWNPECVVLDLKSPFYICIVCHVEWQIRHTSCSTVCFPMQLHGKQPQLRLRRSCCALRTVYDLNKSRKTSCSIRVAPTLHG